METAGGNVVWIVNVRVHREVQVTGPGRQGEQGGMVSMWQTDVTRGDEQGWDTLNDATR